MPVAVNGKDRRKVLSRICLEFGGEHRKLQPEGGVQIP
jgi:hypothetical protein